MLQTAVSYDFRFNRKKKLNTKGSTKGKALVQIRMYLNGDVRYFKTNIYLSPDEWRDSTRKNEPKDRATLHKLNAIVLELADFEKATRNTLGSFRLNNFDDFGKTSPQVKPKDISQTSFVDFMIAQHQAEKVLKQPSWRIRGRSIELFQVYKKEVLFGQLNYGLIEGFDFFLCGRGLHANTIEKHHKHIKKYILRAIKDDLLTVKANPYGNDNLKFDPKTVPYHAQQLNAEELKRFENLTFDQDPTKTKERFNEKVRDMFLFSCFTGMRFNDVYTLKKDNFSHDGDGLTLTFKAGKTQKEAIVHLYLWWRGKPEVIAQKYMPTDTDRTMFKGLTNPKVNKALKVLAIRAKISLKICYKDSRNTFAARAEEQGLPHEVIQTALQHSSLGQTTAYIKRTGEHTKKALLKTIWT